VIVSGIFVGYRTARPGAEGPRRAAGPFGDRLVFAVWNGAGMILEEEPLSLPLLQFTTNEAMSAAPYQAWTYSMQTERLNPLRSTMSPVPLSPFLPTYTAERFFAAPGLLAQVGADENEAEASTR
jgi:hypothetical protein